jgi:hypothetical protein
MQRGTVTAARALPEGNKAPAEQPWREIQEALQGLQYGSVTVVVHDPARQTPPCQEMVCFAPPTYIHATPPAQRRPPLSRNGLLCTPDIHTHDPARQTQAPCQEMVALICIRCTHTGISSILPVIMQINGRIDCIVAYTRAFRRFSPVLTQINLLHTMRKRYGSGFRISKSRSRSNRNSWNWFPIGLSYLIFQIKTSLRGQPHRRLHLASVAFEDRSDARLRRRRGGRFPRASRRAMRRAGVTEILAGSANFQRLHSVFPIG